MNKKYQLKIEIWKKRILKNLSGGNYAEYRRERRTVRVF